MGALPHMALHLTPELDGIPFLRISRPELAAPSVGQHSVHVEEQQALLGIQLRVAAVYSTDRGLEELTTRRGDEELTLGWLADRLRDIVDLNPEFEASVERLASWLARLDEDGD